MYDVYNPKTYTERIEQVIELALRNGIKVELVDNKLSICNTVAKIESSIDLTRFIER